MAYLPYRMYGNGGVHLPIIDIVQTINSTAHVCRVNKPSKTATTTSSKGLYSIREKFEYGPKRSDKQSLKFWKKKSASYDFLPKESQEINEMKNHKRTNLSKTKILKYRKNPPQIPSKMFHHERENDTIGEKKSLQVLFKATKSNSIFDRDGMEEEEPNFSFLRGPFTSSADLKRKGSFAVSVSFADNKPLAEFPHDKSDEENSISGLH